MAHDVFISYAANDKTIADAVCAGLEADRIRCWIAPRDVLPGKRFAQVIVDAIHDARVFVLVFSAASNGSPQVEREADRAVSFGLPILPLRVEDVVPSESMEYYLAGQHWLDALTPPLESHLSRLSQAISILLQPTPTTDAPVGGSERMDGHAVTPTDASVATVAEMPEEAVAETPEEALAQETAPDVVASHVPPVESPPVFEDASAAVASSVAGEIVAESPPGVEELATAPPAAGYADWELADTALAAIGVPLPAAKAASEPEPAATTIAEPEPAPKAAPEPQPAATAVAGPEPAARAGWRLPLIVGAIAGVAWILIIAISELATR